MPAHVGMDTCSREKTDGLADAVKAGFESTRGFKHQPEPIRARAVPACATDIDHRHVSVVISEMKFLNCRWLCFRKTTTQPRLKFLEGMELADHMAADQSMMVLILLVSQFPLRAAIFL